MPASRSRSSARARSWPPKATPTEALAYTSSVPTRKGWFNVRCSRSPKRTARPGSCTRSSSTPNSSPPTRAASIPGRSTSAIRRPIPRSSSSPAWWPRPSLTSLKRSRSMKNTETTSPRRCRRASPWPSRSRKRARFGKPVSGSCSAWCASSSSMRRRTVTSCICETKYRTRPASSLTAETPTWTQSSCPSRCGIRNMHIYVCPRARTLVHRKRRREKEGPNRGEEGQIYAR